MEMQTDNPSLPYNDPIATPDAGISPEILALSAASDAGHVSRVGSILSSLPEGTVLPIPAEQYISRVRLRSATNDLQDASMLGDIERVRWVMEAWKADPSLEDPMVEDMGMALILAAQNAKGNVVRFLLDEGVHVGLMAPKLAARDGDGAVEVFQAFLDHGWDINSFDRIPALHTATISFPLTEWFLDHGADPNLISKDGHTPLDFAVTYSTPTTPSIVDMLLSSGASLTYSNVLHNALISIQSDTDCIGMMQFLLDRGVDINFSSFTNQPGFQSWNPGTALHWAVKKHGGRRGKKNMLVRVKWLLDHGANAEMKDSEGKTPVERASDEALINLLSAHEDIPP
ncbi:ankyrin [Whalleya microplaca]|nr:ankyrin [Whalleya microplaca]